MNNLDPQLQGHAQSPYTPLQASRATPYNTLRLPPITRSESQSSPSQYYVARQEYRPQPAHVQSPNFHPGIGLAEGQQHSVVDLKEDAKRSRACEACRGLKVRCDPDASGGPCRRCAKAHRNCVITAPSRKRQKKTDNRVAELEKKIDALTASLNRRGQGEAGSVDESSDDKTIYTREHKHTTAQPAPAWSQASSHAPSSPNGRRKRRLSLDDQSRHLAEESTALTGLEQGFKRRGLPKPSPPIIIPPLGPSLPNHEYADVVDRKILDMSAASKIFDYYVQKMAPHMPAVVFAPGVTVGETRRTKPILFLSILSVACIYNYPDLMKTLIRELNRAFAERVIVKCEKSLELIQALQISAIWHRPEDHSDTRSFQLVLNAATVAMAMGLNRRWEGCDLAVAGKPSSKADTIAQKRAWISCFILGSNTSIGLKQVSIVRWTSYMDEVLGELENSLDALPSDQTLACYAKITRIANNSQEACSGLDGMGVAMPTSKCLDSIANHVRQLLEVEKSTKHSSSFPLALAFRMEEMFIRLRGLKLEKPFEPLERQPQGQRKENAGNAAPNGLAAPQIVALRAGIDTTHRLLEAFLSFTHDQIYSLPALYLSRVAYAIIALLCIQLRVPSGIVDSGGRQTIDRLCTESYLDRLQDKVKESDGRPSPAPKLQMILRMLKTWYQRRGRSLNPSPRSRQATARRDLQPVDIEQTSPQMAYRRISMPTEQTSEPQVTRKMQSESPRQQQHEDVQPSVPVSPMPQADNSSLHLLSRVATSDEAVPVPDLNTQMWYNGNNSNAYQTQQQIPYIPDQQLYYQNMDGSSYPPDTGCEYQGLVLDPAVEHAMGMAFGVEGNINAIFLDNVLFGGIQQNEGNMAYGNWSGNGQHRS